MTTKLTLSIQKQTVKDIKRLAKEQGTSVSAMFERFARAVATDRKTRHPIGPLTKSVSGILKSPKNKTDRALLEDALMEKYDLS